MRSFKLGALVRAASMSCCRGCICAWSAETVSSAIAKAVFMGVRVSVVVYARASFSPYAFRLCGFEKTGKFADVARHPASRIDFVKEGRVLVEDKLSGWPSNTQEMNGFGTMQVLRSVTSIRLDSTA